MNTETALMIPRLWVTASRLHRQRRPSLARRAALALLRTVVPCCGGGDCEHPS